MKKNETKEIIEKLGLVYDDCMSAIEFDAHYDWDNHCFKAMACIIKEGIDHIKNQACQITDLGWEINPERMGR